MSKIFIAAPLGGFPASYPAWAYLYWVQPQRTTAYACPGPGDWLRELANRVP